MNIKDFIAHAQSLAVHLGHEAAAEAEELYAAFMRELHKLEGHPDLQVSMTPPEVPPVNALDTAIADVEAREPNAPAAAASDPQAEVSAPVTAEAAPVAEATAPAAEAPAVDAAALPPQGT